MTRNDTRDSDLKNRSATLTEASLLLAVVFLGTNPVAVKVAVAESPPLPFVAMRFTLAGLLLLTLVALFEARLCRSCGGTRRWLWPHTRSCSGASGPAIRAAPLSGGRVDRG